MTIVFRLLLFFREIGLIFFLISLHFHVVALYYLLFGVGLPSLLKAVDDLYLPISTSFGLWLKVIEMAIIPHLYIFLYDIDVFNYI